MRRARAVTAHETGYEAETASMECQTGTINATQSILSRQMPSRTITAGLMLHIGDNVIAVVGIGTVNVLLLVARGKANKGREQ